MDKDKDKDKFNFLSAVQAVIHEYNELEPVLKKYLAEQKLTSEDKKSLLNDLSIILINETYSLKTANICAPILLDLLSRASDMVKDDDISKHEWLCICLSKLIWYFPDVARFAKLYFEEKYGFFSRFEDDSEPQAKKQKTEDTVVPICKLLNAANMLLIYDSHSFKDLCDWSVIVPFLNDEDTLTRWFAYQCLFHIANIKDRSAILKNKFIKEEFFNCAINEIENQPWNFRLFRPLRFCKYAVTTRELKLQKNDFYKDVVYVEGVLLSRSSYGMDYLDKDKFVYVPSIQESLHLLALAVNAGEPILLQGPVGCGKTSIIEHLAALTGRRPFEELLKVQLGDHMDSKMLLGTHCCTEVPGEFIWKSGILIQAMTEGHWLLLEDIDCAPMDVISLLVPVLQSRTIVLPGHANPIKAAPGFQLFVTQRLIRGFEGSYVEFRNNIQIIEKQFRKIFMRPFSRDELKQVIHAKWKGLECSLERIMEIYSLFSVDLNDKKTFMENPIKEPFNLYCHHGRLVSTRDLFKFCERISTHFKSSSKKDVSIPVFHHAIECFCDSIPVTETRMSMVESVGAKLNISSTKANAILQKKVSVERRDNDVLIGRVSFPRTEVPMKVKMGSHPVFAHTRHSCALLEKVAVSAARREPVLLVGETGTGKTSVVQYLAHLTQHKLTVINMSQQSDSVDLIGGYKPVDLVFAVKPVKDKFLELFAKQNIINFDMNNKFIEHVSNCFFKKKYSAVAELILHAQKNILSVLLKKQNNSVDHLEQISTWKSIGEEIKTLMHQIKQSKNTLIFKFIEGALVKAMKNGDWLLLDEINLAEAETLECLAGILERDDNTLFLYEKGSKDPVVRHPNFQIFACMNPATDVGKKDLPVGIRNRFTEFFVEEIEEKHDLSILVQEYLKTLSLKNVFVENIVKFFLDIKKISTEKLSDGTGHYPHYSLRTLCRALKYASTNPCHNVPRSLYEGFCLSFLSQLDNESHSYVSEMIGKELLGKNEMSVLKQSIPEPGSGKHTPISGYWIRSGPQEPIISENYIFTKTVKRNLQDLARIVSASRYPVLLQGDTSVGKTSLIQWLAKASGNICVRINNHEHTDIQEYVGTYSADVNGKLVFKEGILAGAMRNGYWIILDELNLAPTEVMEALNRVLDDNRELFIPETQTLIKAHPGFMVFATQNPPGLYGGRKLLSRAFRNRFIELHFNEIPSPELEVILHQRCKIPLSYSKALVAVMHDLQMRRRESGVFSGKQGFITLRDLFRWGERYEKTEEPPGGLDWLQHLADEGYLLLAGRVRNPEETKVIQDAIKKHLKREVKPDLLFNLSKNTSLATREILTKALNSTLSEEFKNVVWTYNMRRLAVLVGKAVQYKEPVLLIGTTGSGKTTICQMYAELFGKSLKSINCHMHSESSDFLGGLRPVRDPEQRESKLFEWTDGPLIQAMLDGNFFLADEISLADDSVLERLNSVLEYEQKIVVPERCFDESDKFEITASKGFHFFATMNPGGDYGKKELSPALRNRFTEIWCPNAMSMTSDIIAIVEHNISKKLKFKKYVHENDSGFGHAITEFLKFYSNTDTGRRTTLSIRDILTWVEFINLSQGSKELSPYEAYIHGAFVAFLDGIGSGSSSLSNEQYLLSIKQHYLEFLIHQVGENAINFIELMIPEIFTDQFENVPFTKESREKFGVGPFNIECNPSVDGDWSSQYVLEAVTPKSNLLKVLRAMQLPKPILLEGSPGVGKTSLISTLAKVTGHGLVRINLSEQTDITDLFGTDLPVEGGENGEFAWRDGPLLQALKKGHWILLDELNLASQSVLEGLNACLDHRNEIFIPELGSTFSIDKSLYRIFCCQNPQKQGGSRKGLPQSFLNRFTQVYMKSMEGSDMEFISTCMFPAIPPEFIAAMVQFNNEVSLHVTVKKLWGQQGAPWEFNLRDIFRWCEVMIANQSDSDYNIGAYMKLIYRDRLRTKEDKEKIVDLFNEVIKRLGLKYNQMAKNRILELNVFENSVQLGHAFLPRKGIGHTHGKMTCISPSQLVFLESLMKCIEMNWMPILVGPSGSGKSTLVHVLADLCGQELHILSVNSEMDTIELLGGFEQADINRKIEFIAQDLQPILEQGIQKCLMTDKQIDEKSLQQILFHQHEMWQCIYSGSSVQKDNFSRKLNCLKDLIKCLESLNLDISNNTLSSCKNAVEDLMRTAKSQATFSGGKFEWVDSMLVNAVKKGHWILIDDANFCSPSVLDRLNALLEPGGVLTINEQGIVNGQLRTIVPHKDFRIILALNPKYGEISRAMRNRGIEIYIEPAVNQITMNEEVFNASLFAQCRGLIHNTLLLHFCTLYQRLSQCPEVDTPSLTDFISAVSLCVQMIQKHGFAPKAFEDSCIAVFAENNLNATARNIVTTFVKLETKRILGIKGDHCIPIIDLLPTSYDFKQSTFLACLKKQNSLFTMFFRDYLGKITECPPFPEAKDNHPAGFVCPPPQMLVTHHLNFRNDIKKFTVVMRIVFESAPLRCFEYQIYLLQHFISSTFSILPASEKDLYRPFCASVMKYREMIEKLYIGSLMKNLTETSVCIFKEIGLNDVFYTEVPFDLRWNPYLFEKVMLLLKQKNEDPDSIEYEFTSRANRFKLLLMHRSLTFVNELSTAIPNCKNLAACAEEVAKNPALCKNPSLLPLLSLPKVVEAFTASFLEFIEDESMPCSDENYWELYEILTAYSAFQKVYLMHAEKGMECQLRMLGFHFSWILKKVQNLYEGVCSVPPALTKYAEELEIRFAYNLPIQKIRHNCMKLLGLPFPFPEERAAEINRRVTELYLSLNLVERLKGTNISVRDLKTIITNLKPWLSNFSHAAFLSIFEKDKRVDIADPKVFTDIQEVKSQMIDSGIIESDDDDEIMEVCQKPAKFPTMSDFELLLQLQLLPLWDYIFITYETEMLSIAPALSLQDFESDELIMQTKFVEVILNWGNSILALNPVYLSHINGFYNNFKNSLTPCLLYFFKHTRHGFSSDCLSTLNFRIENNNIQKEDVVNKHWNKNYSWTKQQPLLTHIISTILGKSGDSNLMCHFPLGSYSQKINQLKKAQVLVWKHFDRLADAKKTFRHYSAIIVISWFESLIRKVATLGGVESAELKKHDILSSFEKLQIVPLFRTEGNENIFLLAYDSVEELQKKLLNGDNSNLQWHIGKAYTLVGLFTLMILMPRDHFDPAMKTKVKISNYKENLSNLEFEFAMRKWVNDITCAQSLKKEWILEHPHIRGLHDLHLKYSRKIGKMEKKVPFRSNDEQLFCHLKTDIYHFTENLGSPERIVDIVSKLGLVSDIVDENELNHVTVIHKALNLSENLQSYVDELLRKYHLFPDLLIPFLLGVEQVSFGLSMSCHSVTIKESLIGDPPQKMKHINTFLEQFSTERYFQFSSEEWESQMDTNFSSLHMVTSMLNGSTIENFSLILSLCKEYFPNRGQLLYKFMKSAILELTNEIKFQNNHPKSKLIEIKELLFSAFQCFYKAWQIQDEIKKRKKADKEKLYKTVQHDNELSDEEKMDKELKEMFPLYEEDFKDTSDEMDCSDTEKNSTTVGDATNDEADSEVDIMVFSDADMFEVCQLHATAVALLSDNKTDQSKNLFIKFDEELDLVTPFLLRHEIISCIVTTLGHRLDSSFEKSLIGEQLLLCQELQKVRGGEENDYYDIYHDPNPGKVLTINPILQKLVNHVFGLLKEFPENPNLIQILNVTQRVLSFPVSDPLMKFVVGLELILETAQLWEQNAHSKVSLKLEIEELTAKIIEFRSMELDIWKKGLQNIIKKHYVRSSKWWFFMFPLFYTDNTYAESEKALIIKGLQQCLEDSPIGEFPARLSILHTFLQEFHLYSASKLNRCYANILFNVYTYYEQFLPAVENEIAQIRKPIEKELKEYVKIARWNDLNFYAVKTSVDKSHRYVLKHVKAFEDGLQKPAKAVFILPSKKNSDSEKVPWSLDIQKKDFIYDVPKVRTEYFKQRSEPFFQKFPKYQRKIKKLSKRIAETFPVVGYINTLNDFCGNIIEALESATIDGQKSVCTRSREKKQALLKIQNKKQMLSTLFKNLRVIGLSYRQGIMKCNEDRITEFMSIPAFDISKMKILKSDLSFKELLSKSSSDTNHYLYKSLAQYAQLQRLMESPSKDLTLDIIHRIQGYGSHLLTLISSQRISIVKMLKDVDSFGGFLSVLSNVYEKQDYAYEKNLTVIPPQQYFKESNLQMSNLMVLITLAAGQFNALLDCAPEPSFMSSEESFLSSDLHFTPLDKRHLSHVLKGDDAWSSIKRALNAFNCDIKKHLHGLSELKFDESVASWDHLRTFSSLCESIHKSMKCLMIEISKHCDPGSALIQNLYNLYNRVSVEYDSLRTKEDMLLDSQMHSEPLEESEQSCIFAKLCQKLATQVALAIQEMVVFSTTTKENEDEKDVVPDGLFTTKITGSLSKTREYLRFDKISKLIRKMKMYFARFQNSTETLLSNDKNFRLLVNLAPMLNQYYQIIKVYLAISLGMHRTSCKFLTILLEIFTILSTKGFCIPPELQEEAAKAGATKFEDIESGGLGEGEGTKDVSGNIESVDQLDDALQEGQEKKENDESNNKDLKNEEDGIEMPDDFEGRLHGGEEDNAEDSEENDENEEAEDLEKQMGDVEADEADKLDDKVWGSDSENEDELRDEDGSGGVTENAPSELVAKDNKLKEDADEEDKRKEQSEEVPADQPHEEYEGEKPDPMINAPPSEEPEIADLPEEMEIIDEIDDGEGENPEEIDEPIDKLEESQDESDEDKEGGEDVDEDKDDGTGKAQEDADGETKEDGNIADQEETEQPVDESDADKNEHNLPTQTPTTEVQALPSSETKKSSSDPVQTEELMDWETGAQSSKEQHKEGLSDATNMPNADPGHEGKKSSSKSREVPEPKQTAKLKPPGENRSVDDSVEEQNAKKRPIKEKSNNKSSEMDEDGGEMAEMYEHVSKEEESKVKAMDIATQEQAKIRTAQNQNIEEEDEEIIELSSSDEDEEQCNKAVGETLKTGQSQKPGDKGDKESETVDIPEGEIIQTQTVSRGTESTVHTQNELWRLLSSKSHHPERLKQVTNVATAPYMNTCDSEELWRKLEMPVSNLSQELCEQLRLVLEPTKMSKFKGDYRTGKRLNMRKIIPYIASQFRKDKIWLRRTKPSKRQYQIMLAMDDSSSMSYNNAKQLAFESLVVLGQSLTLLEAGELSVVSFGEKVQLLHSFQDQFSSSTGAKILEQITFAQKETKIVDLLDYATSVMVQARNSSHSSASSKETAQLLIIISDGRNIFREGESKVKNAVKNARDNNVFMVFLVLDSMENKKSILDGKYSWIEDEEIKSIPYMDKFPFPFYIILREISALPQVLGEALRQWFELVTSVDR